MLSAWIPAEEKKASTVAPACSAHGVSHSGGTPALAPTRIDKMRYPGFIMKLANCQW